MKKLKLATIVGTRPELIRLSVIINKCDKFFEHSLIHTGQNYDFELNEIFFKERAQERERYFWNQEKKLAKQRRVEAIEIQREFEKQYVNHNIQRIHKQTCSITHKHVQLNTNMFNHTQTYKRAMRRSNSRNFRS
mgnify:CR=1 FL=1